MENMMKMETFRNQEFGSVRIIWDDGRLLFCGADVAFALGADHLKLVQGVQDNPGKPRPCGSDILCFYGQDQQLCFYKSVVSSFQLSAENLGVQFPQRVKPVTLGRNLDTLYKILPVHPSAGKGQLHTDGAVMGIVKVAECFKDGSLIVRLGKLIIYILKLDAPGPGSIIQFTQSIRVHLPEG